MAGLFITASGTGIGKTYLTAELIRWDRLACHHITYSKPIISGWPEDKEKIKETDTAILLEAGGELLLDTNVNAVSPWRLAAPLAPWMAAKRVDTPIDFQALLDYSQQQAKKAHHRRQIHLMEGVGGVMVPICNSITVLDWITQLKWPCILIAGSYLGSLSHTLTAYLALKSRKIEVFAIIVNETQKSEVSMNETVACLSSFVASTPIYSIYFSEQANLRENNEQICSLYEAISTKMGYL